jgi:cysteinyl-tRNA synthetase
MDDDFNTGAALGELYELVRALNRYADQQKLESLGLDQAPLGPLQFGVRVLAELTGILGLFRAPAERPHKAQDDLSSGLLLLLIDLRARLRKEKNFKLADEVRDRLTALGVTLEDRPEGTTWRLQ